MAPGKSIYFVDKVMGRRSPGGGTSSRPCTGDSCCSVS